MNTSLRPLPLLLALVAAPLGCSPPASNKGNPVLKVTPLELDFGTTLSGPLNFKVTNAGTGQMGYRVVKQDPWLAVNKNWTTVKTEIVDSTSTQDMIYAVTIDRAKLGPNESQAQIFVIPDVGSSQTVLVRATSDKCLAGTPRCVDAFTIQTCTSAGAWQTPQPCGTGKYCDRPAAQCRAQQCEPNSFKCLSATSTQQCAADGSTWQDATPCPPDQVCVSTTGSCTTNVAPAITGIDGDGSKKSIVDYRKTVPASAANVVAGYRVAKSLVITGSNLTKVDESQNRLQCVTNPNVFFTNQEGLVFETGGTDMKRRLLLPTSLQASACTLFALTIANSAGATTAQVYVLQGEPGVTSLVDIQAEPAGGNCPGGGQKVLGGLDSNGDGTLAASEVLTTKYLCNGTNGKDGVQGPKGLDAAPTGTIAPFFGNSAPNGWLPADGRSINKTTNPEYGDLVTHLRGLGAKYQGSTTAEAILPDMRGLFIRGKNGQRADAYANPVGDESIGTIEADAYMSHDHGASTSTAGNHAHSGSAVAAGAHAHGFSGLIDPCSGCTSAGPAPAAGSSWSRIDYSTTAAGTHGHDLSIAGAGDHAHAIAASGGTETRPKNMSVLYIIKY